MARTRQVDSEAAEWGTNAGEKKETVRKKRDSETAEWGTNAGKKKHDEEQFKKRRRLSVPRSTSIV